MLRIQEISVPDLTALRLRDALGQAAKAYQPQLPQPQTLLYRLPDDKVVLRLIFGQKPNYELIGDLQRLEPFVRLAREANDPIHFDLLEIMHDSSAMLLLVEPETLVAIGTAEEYIELLRSQPPITDRQRALLERLNAAGQND